MNYEKEIEEILFNELSKKFNIKNRQVLYYYLKLRAYVLGEDPDSQKSMINIIFNELFITEFSYMDIPISVYGHSENSLGNIIENNEDKLYRLNNSNFLGEKFDINKTTKKILSIVNTYAKKQTKCLKVNQYYDYHIKYHSLIKLNEIFGIENIEEVLDINGFHQSESRINEELKCERFMDVSNLNQSFNQIAEKDLEDYLYNNIEKIEEGLTVIGRQIEMSDGRLDILAKDKNDVFTIIELKIKEDKSIIWQCMYYPEELKKRYNVNKVRILTLMPHCPKHLFDSLSKIDMVEIYEYNIVGKKKINNIEIFRKGKKWRKNY